MKQMQTNYTVEVSAEEVDVIRRALEAYHEQTKADYNESHSEGCYRTACIAHDLRNGFSALIGVHYMGKDA